MAYHRSRGLPERLGQFSPTSHIIGPPSPEAKRISFLSTLRQLETNGHLRMDLRMAEELTLAFELDARLTQYSSTYDIACQYHTRARLWTNYQASAHSEPCLACPAYPVASNMDGESAECCWAQLGHQSQPVAARAMM
jgi:hypothetical protein